MNKLTLLAVLALALAGCGSEDSLTNGSFTQSNAPSQPPSNNGVAAREMVGVGADYVVAGTGGGPLTLVGLIDWDSVKARTNLLAVPGATVTYPDGSTQTADANGVFDSSRSSYATRVATPLSVEEGVPTTSVTLQPPGGSPFLAGQDEVILPLASEEATWISGTYSSGDDPQLTNDPNGPGLVRPDGGVRARYQSHTNWPHTIDQYLEGGKNFDGFFRVEREVKTAPEKVTKLHKCSFRTTWNRNFVPYYARAGGPGNGWLEYNWTASWVGGDRVKSNFGGGSGRPTWIWTITTEVQNQTANSVAVSAWPKWWEFWADGEAVDVTIFQH